MADHPDILAKIANVQKLSDVSAALVAQPPVGEVVRQTRAALDALTEWLSSTWGPQAAQLVSALRNHFATVHFQGPSAGDGPAWQTLLHDLVKDLP